MFIALVEDFGDVVLVSPYISEGDSLESKIDILDQMREFISLIAWECKPYRFAVLPKHHNPGLISREEVTRVSHLFFTEEMEKSKIPGARELALEIDKEKDRMEE